MGYVALYRKFRPQKFEDLVGQDAIVRTLNHQLESGRIAHAYLFAGPRGTGKTSCAKLFARAINCAHPVNGNPCGECEACRAALADDNVDILEIDAASNNGVDNIRDIRDKVVFAPAYGKYKVYIIDEVHMLSGGAFNALLKTLEEPPAHVVFILATTELHKLPATILSRCQRFDFKLIPLKTIVARLTDVLTQSGASFTDEAVDLIAKCASGGMRDALSLADVCLSYCGQNVTLEDAMNVLGLSDKRFLFEFTEALLASDAKQALTLCRSLETEGKDLGVFILNLMEQFRNLLLALQCPDSEELAVLPGEELARTKEEAAAASLPRVLRALEILASLEAELKNHARADILLETAVARICLPEGEDDLLALKDRIQTLEDKLASGTFTVSSAKSAEKPAEKAAPAVPDAPPWDEPEKPAVSAPVKEAAKPSGSAPAKPAPAKPSGGGSGSALYQAFLAKVKNDDLPLYMILRSFTGTKEDDKLVLWIPEEKKSKEAVVTKNAEKLSRLASESAGETLTVVSRIGAGPSESGGGDLMKAALDMFS